jgi:hypothetical protein
MELPGIYIYRMEVIPHNSYNWFREAGRRDVF